MLRIAKMGDKPEVFYTIQGEGASMGRPAVFVRLSLCNLRCAWCDTPYTWNWDTTPYLHDDNIKYSKSKELMTVSEEELADIVREFDCKRVVITGGEPLLQAGKLPVFMDALGEGYIFEVETNGTIMPDFKMVERVAQFNISPKLEGSGNPEGLRRKDGVLRHFATLPSSQFKFVVTERSDLDEIMELVETCAIPADKVWVMPEGRTQAAVTEDSAWLVEECKRLGFNFTTRLHILIYSTERGR